MKKRPIVIGLDIGSSKAAAVAAAIGPEGSLDILAQASQASHGVSRGAIVDLNEAVKSVSGVLNKVRGRISARPAAGIYVNISGESIRASLSRGMIPLAARGREVTGPDIDRCVDAASTIHLPYDREIVHRIVQKFSVDDEPPIKNPIGLYASRLACEAYIITANSNHIQNIFKCVNNAGFDVKEIVFTGIADGAGLLDLEERNEGALVLDMGASLTEACLFQDGAACDIEIIQAGGQDFKGGFRESPEFSNIVSRVKSKLDAVSTITITGGVSFSDGIAEFLEEKLSCRVKMGVAKGIRGEISGIDSVKLSGAIGLVRYAQERHAKRAVEEKNLAGRFSSAVVDMFNNYF